MHKLISIWLGLALGLAGVLVSGLASRAAEDDARAAIQASGIRAGLCVHLGVGDGRLTAALRKDRRFLVHGLAGDDASRRQAREHLYSLGVYGRVSVERGSFERLPYADNLVNVVVARDLPALLAKGLSLGEVVRVLAPRGAACFGKTSAAKVESKLKAAGCTGIKVTGRGGWTVCRKKFPAEMDEWTHWRHGPDGNAVSGDAVGVPRSLRWQAGPLYQTGRHYFGGGWPVSAGGRLFTVTLEEENSAKGPVQRQVLWCRDAHNGLLLWRREATTTRPRLVADGGRLYAVLKRGGPLLALDAASGKPVKTYERAMYPDDWLLHKGALIVRKAPEKGPGEMLCLDAATGAERWKKELKAKSMVVADGKIFCLTANGKVAGELVSLKIADGSENWRSAAASGLGTLLCHYDGVLIFGSGVRRAAQAHGVSARDGKRLWSFKYKLLSHGGSASKVYCVDGVVWVNRASPAGWVGLEPKTGEVKRFYKEAAPCWSRNICATNRATKRFILTRSMLFVDVKTGKYHRPWGLKNACGRSSILPANGLLYAFPHQCACYPMLRGALGLSSDASALPENGDPSGKIEKGPAYGFNERVGPAASGGESWPIYRADERRSGSTKGEVPAEAGLLWETDLGVKPAGLWALEWARRGGGQITAPTIAGGKVFVAQPDRHRVLALDPKTGGELWSHTVGGRVDTPPTIHGRLCLFGSNDGWVYCLKTSDGELVWRFRAAPVERKILAFGQLESAWPVHGSVLVQNGVVHFAAGRHSKIDGGVFLYAIDPVSGRVRWSKKTRDYHGLAGLLVANGPRGTCFASQHYSQGSSYFKARSGYAYGHMTKIDGSLSSNTGLLSEMWLGNFSRARRLSRWAHRGLSAHKMVFDEKTVYCFHLARGGKNACLSRRDCRSAVEGDRSKPVWQVEFPKADRRMPTRHVRALVLTGDVLWGAGRIGKARGAGQLLRAYSTRDGRQLREVKLASPPVYDGIAAAGGRLYVSCTDGKLLCFGRK